MAIVGGWTSCGDHFAVYKNIKSLCCTPETNLVLYVNYTSIKKWSLCCAIFVGMQLKIHICFFLCHSNDPIVTSLAKQKEFDELVHWHSHRPLTDDYDRTKCQFDGEFCDSGQIS